MSPQHGRQIASRRRFLQFVAASKIAPQQRKLATLKEMGIKTP